jgi:hypothetical protein
MLFLFWFSLQGACEGPKIILLFSITWVSDIERTLEVTGLFWFSLQSGCEGLKMFYAFHLYGCTICTEIY